jgi:hypothetical protein
MTDLEKIEFYETFLSIIAQEDDPYNYGSLLPVFANKAINLDATCDGCVNEYKNTKRNRDSGEVPCNDCLNCDFWFPTVGYVEQYFDMLNSVAEKE